MDKRNNRMTMLETVPEAEYNRIEKIVKDRSDNRSFDYLSKCLKNVSSTLEYQEKVKKSDTVESLSCRLVSLVDTVCGLYKSQASQVKKAELEMGELSKETGLLNKIYDIKFISKLNSIIISSLESKRHG